MKLSQLRTVAIVGSGLAGLTMARKIQEAGFEATVFEKSRGPGGRLSSKRVGGGQTVDMGAQFFTIRNPQFEQFLSATGGGQPYDLWGGKLRYESSPGVVEPFHGQSHYVGVPRMTAISRALSDGVNILAGHRVTGVWREEQGWMLAHEGEAVSGPFDALVITAPPEQARDLLADNPEALDQLTPYGMAPCWAMAVRFRQSLGLDFDGMKMSHPVLGWVACNSSKPGREGDEGQWWVIHANSRWSREHAERQSSEISAVLLKSFKERFGITAEPVETITHRWLYAQPDSGEPEGCISLADQRLGLCGDWLAGGRVEGAFNSAMALLDAWGISREAASAADRNE